MKIEFTITSCCRPDILNRTLYSFRENVTDLDLRNSTAYINIDHVPIETDPFDVVNVVKKYFNNIIYNISESPHFCNAVKSVVFI